MTKKWIIIIVAVIIGIGAYVGLDGPLPEVLSNFIGPTQ